MDARTLLRRIALGLPLAALPVGAGVLITNLGCACSCPDPVIFTRSVTSAERMELASMTTGSAACLRLCEDVVVDGGMVDAAQSDAGFVGSRTHLFWTCTFPAEGQVACRGVVECVGGRAPQALHDRARTRLPRSARSRVGDHFASMAHLEAAAVPAFFELARELESHGAHPSMSRAARRSARQEIVHARLVGRLARRFGGEVPEVERGETAPRSLFDMAKDNAFEGCVREAYGALLAAHQAAHAPDPIVRESFARIAKDEAEHALLSLALHDWARARVSDAERRTLDETRDDGVASLLTSVSAEEPERALAIAGLPSATAAHDLVTALMT